MGERELEWRQELEASRGLAEIRLEEEEELIRKAEISRKRLTYLEHQAHKMSDSAALEKTLEEEAAKSKMLSESNEKLSGERRFLRGQVESLEESLALWNPDACPSDANVEELQAQLIESKQEMVASNKALQHSLSQLQGKHKETTLRYTAEVFRAAGFKHALQVLQD